MALLVMSGVLALIAAPLFADVSRSQPADFLARGQLIASGGGPGGGADACFACHGVNGEGQAASGFPRLATLSAQYQAKQLDDYASGARQDPIMSPIAGRLSEQDRRAVASYYANRSGQAVVRVSTLHDPKLLQEGAVLYARGSARGDVEACVNCHGPAAQRIEPIYPALAGQHASYTVEQFRRWRSGARNSRGASAAMEIIAKQLSERDIRAVAVYLSELKLRANAGITGD